MAEQTRSSPARLRILVALVCLNTSPVELKDTSHARKINEMPHHVMSVDSSCTKEHMEVRIGFGSTSGAPPFRGAIHAKGFPVECRSTAANASSENSSQTITFLSLKLPAESCGVSVVNREDGLLAYQVEVDIQWDRNLQQSTDQNRLVSCLLPLESTQETAVKQVKEPKRTYPLHRSRSGREDDLRPSHSIQAWMEVHGNKHGSGKLPHHRSHIVGEQLTMVVKSFLPNGIGARVVNCTAHDGRVNGPEQRLLDGHGCPLDVGIMPAPTSHRRDMRQNGTITSKGKPFPTYEAATSFLAFKFPDRDFLHLRCWLQICKGLCKHEMYVEHDENEITRFEVFNSLSVKAPGIESDTSELDNLSHKEIVGFIDEKIGAGGRLLCMSPSKLALAFAVLGLIFLLAIAISVYVCLRSRRRQEQRSLMGAFYWPPPSLSRSSSNASFLPRTHSSCPFFRTVR